MNIYGISRIPETVRTKKIVGTSFVLGTVQVLAGNQMRIDAVLLVVDCWSATDGAYHNIGIYFLISPEQHSCSVDITSSTASVSLKIFVRRAPE